MIGISSFLKGTRRALLSKKYTLERFPELEKGRAAPVFVYSSAWFSPSVIIGVIKLLEGLPLYE
jgi:hypothetical protein